MTDHEDHSKARRPDQAPVVVVSMISAYFVFAVFAVLWSAEPRRYSAEEISHGLSGTGLTCFVVPVSADPPREIVDCHDEPFTDPETDPQTFPIVIVMMLDAEWQARAAKEPCWSVGGAMPPSTRVLWEEGQNWIGIVLDPGWTNDLVRVLGGEVIRCPAAAFQ